MLLISAGTYEITAADQPGFNGEPPGAPAIQGEVSPIVKPGTLLGFQQAAGNGHTAVERLPIHQRQREQPVGVKGGAKCVVHRRVNSPVVS